MGQQQRSTPLRPSRSLIALVCLDICTALLAVVAIFVFRTSETVIMFSRKAGALFIPEAFAFYCLAALLMPLLFRLNNLYKYRVVSSTYDQMTQIIKSYLTFAFVLIVLLFFFQELQFARSSRGFLLGFALLGIVFVSVERMIVGYVVRRRRFLTDQILSKTALIVGAGHAGETFALRVLNNPELGIEKAYFLDDDPKKIGTSVLGFPVVDAISAVQLRAIDTAADEIYVTMNAIDRQRLLEIIEECKKAHLPVKVLSRHFKIIQGGTPNASTTAGADETHVQEADHDLLSALELTQPFTIHPGLLTKRIMDFVLGMVIFLILLVPGMVISLIIRLTSRGPAMYTSYRIGKGGKAFKMFKFRTMYLNDESEHREAAEQRLKEGKHMGKPERDPRITPIGGFLRKYSIDELPQILNVLRGDMSLIGPRPCLDYELQYFEDWHKRRFLVLPGMTGLWQVTGRQIEGLSLHDAMILDVYYAENFTIWLDLKIILKTIPVVLLGRSKG
jgi:exopolysaccharide biosynthesis polyprenyl glycosylphosphotransferase